MKHVGFSDIKKVFVTLPISYYCGERIPAILQQHGHGTCYNPRTNTIYIDGEQIENFCGNLSDTDDEEVIIRSCLYHELSHALLTPKYPTFPYIINVMEDERIETVMKDYYEGVDFKKNLATVNNWDGTCDEVPKKPTEAFYQIVRYHMAPPTAKGERPAHLVEKAEKIVEMYSSLTADTGANEYYAAQYLRSIRALYDVVKAYYPGNDDEENNDGNDSTADGENTTGDKQKNGATNNQPIGDKDEDYEATPKDYSNDPMKDCGDTATNDGSDDDNEAMPPKRSHRINPRVKSAIQGAVHSMLGSVPCANPKLDEAVERIFASFNKKNSGGASMNCYSGTFNPRNCARDDYRYWEKKAPVNGANKYGSAHLNLFIDVSGSMYNSIKLVNSLLHALYLATARHKEITFSVMAMGEGQRRVDTRKEPYLKATGGNDLTQDIIRQYKEMQKPNTAVYNLVVFDGCAYARGCESNFSAFNHSNCTIISDRDNEDPIKHHAPSARRIITTDYAKEFVDGVIKTLTAAFH